MIRYKEYAPTPFDTKGLALYDERQEWFVAPCGVNRDSEALDRSNWAVQLDSLGGESDDVEVHRFGHWACGWLEIVIVRPGTAAAAEAARIEEDLANHPVLDDAHFSALEGEEAAETWKNCSIRDRVDYCKRYGASIFAARRAELPEDADTDLFVALAR